MKLSSFFSILRENLPEAPDWVDALLGPLNSSFNQIQLALSGNLTIGDNLVGQLSSSTVKTGNTYISAKTFTPIRIPWVPGNKASPKFINIGNCVVPSNQAPQTKGLSIPSWTFDFASSSIVIPYIDGLTDNSTYFITILIL